MTQKPIEPISTTPPTERLWNANYIKIWAGNFLMFFAFMLFTPLLPLYLTDTFGASKQIIGLVLAGYALVALITRFFSGYIVDSFPRKITMLCFFIAITAFFGGYLLAGSLLSFALVRLLQGAPFGALGTSLSTIAIDVLPSSRRAEGIGYYGLSNNLATAISPAVGVLLYSTFHSYEVLFLAALLCSLVGVIVVSTTHLPVKVLVKPQSPVSLDRFFMVKGWPTFLVVFSMGFAYSVVSSYVALYSREVLGITTGTGVFFTLLAVGLIVSRLTGTRSLRRGLIVRNANVGILVSFCGFLLFALVRHPIAYYLAPLVIGLGNGHIFPAIQSMFVNMAPHNQRGTANATFLTGWDAGMGTGMLLGGLLAGHFGYTVTFLSGIFLYFLAMVFYFVFVRRYYVAHQLHS